MAGKGPGGVVVTFAGDVVVFMMGGGEGKTQASLSV